MLLGMGVDWKHTLLFGIVKKEKRKLPMPPMVDGGKIATRRVNSPTKKASCEVLAIDGLENSFDCGSSGEEAPMEAGKNPSTTCRRPSGRVLERPANVDVASWGLIQMHQSEEREVGIKRGHPSAYIDRVSHTLALRLQEKEDRSQTRSSSLLSKEQVLKSLESCQLRAIEYVKTKAKPLHEQSLKALEKRVVWLGFTAQDLH
jgi:hypothetical protein